MKIEYICIDTETTGLDASWCQLLEVGAVTSGGGRFRGVCVYDRIVGEPYALQMNAGLLMLISRYTSLTGDQMVTLGDGTVIGRPARIGQVFNEWRTQFESPIYVGKNLAGFDTPFLKQASIRMPHRVLDVGNLVWFHKGLFDRPLPNLHECKMLMGMSGQVVHEALADAEDCLALLKLMGIC